MKINKQLGDSTTSDIWRPGPDEIRDEQIDRELQEEHEELKREKRLHEAREEEYEKSHRNAE